MIKSFIKQTNNLKIKDGFYSTRYDGKWKILCENKFIENIHKLQLKKIHKGPDEFSTLEILKKRAENTFDLVSGFFMGDSVSENLLFYHWYERKYNVCVIEKNILYTLNNCTITSWFEKIPKDKIGIRVLEEIEDLFQSNRFPKFTIYYEYFYDFFPNIEEFTFSEFREKVFLKYLLDLFSESIYINYKGQKILWRFTDIELNDMGENGTANSLTGSKAHNPIKYNTLNLPSFTPNFLGDKNYERHYVNDKNCHTPYEVQVRFLLRDLENLLRVENGLPKVGEGWISETILYQKIKEKFPNQIIVQHGKPKWLGLQHFDVYFPELNIAVEYQGIQHQKPIDFFGGEQAFIKNQERENRKKKLCIENNCNLFYVIPEDNMDKFVEKLIEFIQ